MVGRENELERMRTWYTQALAGRRRVIFVAGEPGIGKTTFVRSFLDTFATDTQASIGRGQCIEQYGAGEPYMPILEALTRLAQQPGGERVIKILDQCAPSWLAQMPALLDDAERRRLQALTQGVTQARMLREMAQALDALATTKPLVLLLEDLHWSDYSMLDLLGSIARRTEPARLLVIGTYRPVEILGSEHPLRALKTELEVHQQCEELRLRLLNRHDITAYLERRFAPEQLRSFVPVATAIHARTEGNPLFMVNVVDYLIEQGTLLDMGVIEAPRTIQQMIERNLEQLSVEEQRVLEAASVAGAEFSVATIAAALGLPVPEIEAYCTRLMRHEQFIAGDGASQWPDGTMATRYRFLHALYQEVLYRRIPIGGRGELHRRIAQRQEQAYGEHAGDIATQLAYHFDGCGDKSKTLQYLELAGHRAVERHAYPEAEKHYRDALQILERLPESSERDAQELQFQVALGSVIATTKGFSAADTAATYTRARILAERGGEESLQVFYGLAGAALTQGQPKSALALADQFLEIARKTGSARSLFIAHAAQGSARHFLGDLLGAQQHFNEATTQYRYEDFCTVPNNPCVNALVWAASTEWHLGHPDRGLSLAEDALVLARRLGNPFTVAFALFGKSRMHLLRGEFEQMHAAIEENLKLATSSGFPLSISIAKIYQAYARARLGDCGNVVKQIQEGVAQLDVLKFYLGRAFILGCLSEIQALTGHLDEAFITVETALQINPEELLYRPNLFRQRGDLRLKKNEINLAEQDFRNAIDLARSMNSKSLELRAASNLARLLVSTARQREARLLLSKLFRWFGEGFNTADLQQAAALLSC